ncbi:helix-turn-helix domain-containing protein [Streptomyces cinnabarinus]|uniref:Helix-turn-helix domain-containing protein n=1 Tax=Streptomyces cinnabarinus TaxID=67287 RepID=A0ABY7KP28_9ACTN|nr:helix-turn-helix domain-containing protein [Streptomyces cinnabarinus]WAZ26327.1 helix-turn-helix domain-containing protein [Streptomyces cinnabarinus]
MSPVLDTTLIPPQDREEFIRHAVCESVVAVDIDHHRPAGDISAQMKLGAMGPMTVLSARSTAATVERTQRLARVDEEPAVFLGLQVSGNSLVVQNGRECLLRPGDFAVYESAAPYTLVFDEGVDHHFFRIPRAALALPERLLRDATAVRMDSQNPVAGLAFTYFSQLAVTEELHEGSQAAAVVEPSIELIRAVVASHMGNSGVAKVPLEATLSLRITQYIRTHLSDPDLSAAHIAAAHTISVRHLYAVLARSGISLGDWIRSHRLAECRRELAGPNGRLRTIGAISRSWGFVDATHFSKVFKQTYGISPRAWREQHHPGTSKVRSAPEPD